MSEVTGAEAYLGHCQSCIMEHFCKRQLTESVQNHPNKVAFIPL